MNEWDTPGMDAFRNAYQPPAVAECSRREAALTKERDELQSVVAGLSADVTRLRDSDSALRARLTAALNVHAGISAARERPDRQTFDLINDIRNALKEDDRG